MLSDVYGIEEEKYYLTICSKTEDFIAWHFDSKGVFSVKSAYKVHVEMEKRSAVTQVCQGSNFTPLRTEVFRKIWKIPCPPKVHHLLWRLAHNSHPLYLNIARRGVELDTRCEVCHKYFEDGGHLFLACKSAKQRWRSLMLEDVRLKLLPFCSVLEILQEILQLQLDEQLLSAAFLWSCWAERNKGNHGEVCQTVDQFQFNVCGNVHEWKQFLKTEKNPTVQGNNRWEAPPNEWVKINTNASFSEVTKLGGWGAICRDDSPYICFAAAGHL